MDARELILGRHSVRDFLPDPIPKDIINEILEAGRLAPSTQNRQPWRYLVFFGKCQNPEISIKLWIDRTF